MANRIKHNYIDAEQLKGEWLKWRDSSTQIDERIITNELGQMILDIATHLTSHKQFVGYPQYMKDDMVSDGVMKCIKNLKNIKGEFNGRQIFNYLTRACFTAIYDYLSDHYKEVNLKRELLLASIEKMSDELGQGEGYIIDELRRQIDEYTPDKNKLDDEIED